MNGKLLSLVIGASTSLALLALFAAPTHASVLIPAGTPVVGVSQQELARQYAIWQITGFGLVADEQPLVNTSNTSPVTFLPVTFEPTATYNLNITAGMPVFFPLVMWVGWFADQASDSPPCNTAVDRWACNQGALAAEADNPSSLTLRVDGVSIAVSDEHRQDSAGIPFHHLLGPNGLGIDPGDYEWLFDGWWAALAPLSPGLHVVEYGFDYQGSAILQTANLSVLPVSSTAGLVVLGLLALAVQRRQRA